MYINAVKRSGKTRLLKLIAKLASNGIYTAELTEAVLFRLPSVKNCSLCIDEAENISSKEKGALRLLLNSAYKKGMKIYRARKSKATEKYVIDEFEIFMPISIANIYGIDDVLEDRCITIILERSSNIGITSKPEYFDLDLKFEMFKYIIDELAVHTSVGSACQYVKKQYTNYRLLSSILRTTGMPKQAFNTTYTTNTIYTTDILDTEDNKELEYIIRNTLKSGILGRDLECWYPLFIINSHFNNNGFDKDTSLQSV